MYSSIHSVHTCDCLPQTQCKLSLLFPSNAHRARAIIGTGHRVIGARAHPRGRVSSYYRCNCSGLTWKHDGARHRYARTVHHEPRSVRVHCRSFCSDSSGISDNSGTQHLAALSAEIKLSLVLNPFNVAALEHLNYANFSAYVLRINETTSKT